MGDIVLIEQDPFVEDVANIAQLDSNTKQYNVRRPLYGAMHKEDQFANIAVKGFDDEGKLVEVLIPNSSAIGGSGTTNYNFIVNNFVYQQQEKVQIIETFGEEYAFFFGKKPTVVNVQGFLLNTPDFNWRNEWYFNYEHYLRGTKCVERKSRVYLTIDGLVFVGYILNCGTQLTDQSPRITPFNFTMLVTNFRDINLAKVTKAEESRQKEQASQASPTNPYVEFLGDGGGKLQSGVRWDEVQQKYISSRNLSGEVEGPGSVESPNTAYWLAAPEGSGLKHTYTNTEAMKELAIKRYQSKNSVTRFEAVAAYNSGQTLFSSSSSISKSSDIEKALGSDIRGGIVRTS